MLKILKIHLLAKSSYTFQGSQNGSDQEKNVSPGSGSESFQVCGWMSLKSIKQWVTETEHKF